MIRTVIIDDEVNSRDNIRQMLKLYCNDVFVLTEADGVKSGIECINQYNPDLVFLDIKMQDGTGFDMLNQLAEINFRVIFVTAYEEYAIKAIKFNALDYITKPIDPDELISAVDRAMSALNDDTVKSRIQKLLETANPIPSPGNRKIVLRTSNTVHVIDIDRIIHCEADRNYTVFYLDGEERILIAKSMKEFIDVLESHGFFRVHNSHLINLNYVRRFLKEELICVLKDNSNIPVAFRKRDDLLNKLSKL
ncbi:MAG: LytTR family DNA-binding domain-containing protein [Lentimicrobiaceae bacterium]